MENTINILHLDDEKMNSDIFEIALTYTFKTLPINWYYAQDNKSAISLLQNLTPIHILISDIKRFRNTNQELHEYLLLNSIFPIKMLYSAHYNSFIIKENKLLNYSEYLRKPYDIRKLPSLFTHTLELVDIIKKIAAQQNKSFYEIYSQAPTEIINKGINRLIVFFERLII